jgi:Zn-dependent alcohol dehydrogenase
VHESQLVSVPVEIPLDSVALLGCAVITGLGAVINTARVSSGSSVAVIGLGGVGLNCVQGAMLVGAQPVIAVDLAENKLEAAKVFGATHTINGTTANVREAVRDFTGQRGADYVFVAVGRVAAMEQGLTLLRRGGTLVIAGMPASGVKMQFEPVILADRGQCILGSKMGSTRLGMDVPKLVELYQQGRLKLDELISARYPLIEINAAIAVVNRGEALRNVIVF